MRLRVPRGEWRVKMFQAYGADPQPMSLKTVFVALQTGAVDGQENPLTQIYSQKFQDVQAYLSMTGHVYTPAYLIAGANFARLPPDVQKILAETAREVEPDVLKLAARLDDELLDKIKQSGIKVNAVDKSAFVVASKKIYEEFSQQVPAGKQLIDKCLSLANGP
jgi:TRAP-type C4-dicarboxylate transport system substrate-binding protein